MLATTLHKVTNNAEAPRGLPPVAFPAPGQNAVTMIQPGETVTVAIPDPPGAALLAWEASGDMTFDPPLANE